MDFDLIDYLSFDDDVNQIPSALIDIVEVSTQSKEISDLQSVIDKKNSPSSPLDGGFHQQIASNDSNTKISDCFEIDDGDDDEDDKSTVYNGEAINDNDLSCHTCLKIFTRKDTLKRHVKIHNGTNNEYACKFCQKGCRSKYDLELHKRTSHEDDNFKCVSAGCTESFKSKSGLSYHQFMKHDIKSGATICCKICSMKFCHKKDCHSHLYRVHNKKLFLCESCNQSFIHEYMLKKHYEACGIKDRVVDKMIPCTFSGCVKVFRERRYMYEHLKFGNNTDGAATCKKCGKCFLVVQP